MALRGRGVAKSLLGGTVTEDKLTSTSAVVIAIITVRAMLSVVACLKLGIKTVSYSTLVCGNVVMMFAFALDGPWYILNLIVRTVGHHLNHFIASAFGIAAFAHTALGEERPKDGQCAKVDCLGPSRRRFHGTHLSQMHYLPRGHVPLALPVCCAVVLHLRCSWHQHELTRHLVGEHRHHGFRQRGLLPPRGHELSAQRRGHVLRRGGEHLRRGMLSPVCSTRAAIPQDTSLTSLWASGGQFYGILRATTVLRLHDLAVPEQVCDAEGFQVTPPTSSDARSFSQLQFGCI